MQTSSLMPTGLDLTLPTFRRSSGQSPEAVPRPTLWTAEVIADRAYFETLAAENGTTVPFPPYCPLRHIPLTGDRIQIGRRSTSRGLTPEIDLCGPPCDPGVSHLHAVLVARADGWDLIDPGSTNGVTLNDDPGPVEANRPVHLHDGDCIHLGVWTTITLGRSAER
ncbi:MAG: domain containing protein [Actinomycetia bacterium]|nr:domain containing protein [Actinomycetes bacterium]